MHSLTSVINTGHSRRRLQNVIVWHNESKEGRRRITGETGTITGSRLWTDRLCVRVRDVAHKIKVNELRDQFGVKGTFDPIPSESQESVIAATDMDRRAADTSGPILTQIGPGSTVHREWIGTVFSE